MLALGVVLALVTGGATAQTSFTAGDVAVTSNGGNLKSLTVSPTGDVYYQGLEQAPSSVEVVVERLSAVEERHAAETERLTDAVDDVAAEVDEIRRWHRRLGRLLEDFAALTTRDGEADPAGAPGTDADETAATAGADDGAAEPADGATTGELRSD